jgi:hypothetical protein
LVEETGVPGENHQPVASHWQTLSHNHKFPLSIMIYLYQTCWLDPFHYSSCWSDRSTKCIQNAIWIRIYMYMYIAFIYTFWNCLHFSTKQTYIIIHFIECNFVLAMI